MMIDPPIDKLIDKVGCKYALVCVTAKRAKQIADKAQENCDEQNENPVTKAAKEIYEGKVIAVEEE